MPDPVAASVQTARPRVRINVLSGGSLALAYLAGMIIRTWVATLRITTAPESAKTLGRCERPVLFALWHDRLFMAGAIARQFRGHRPLHALISTSKDGAWLTAFFATMGLCAVRGSSSKGGREAASQLIGLLRDGHDAGITPDGPRGPAHIAKPGALIVARRGGAEVVLLGFAYEKSWRLRSWDKFQLPYPFSRVQVVARLVEPSELEGDSAAALARLENELRAINP